MRRNATGKGHSDPSFLVSMHRILRVARTIADLVGSADILGPHVAEAIRYRRGERVVEARAA